MKKIPVKYIVFSGLATIIGGFFHACTESQSFTPDWVDSKPDHITPDGLPARNLRQRLANQTLCVQQ